MRIDVLDMLDDYGIDIKVRSQEKTQKYDMYGMKLPEDLSIDNWEERHEPVFSDNKGRLAKISSGGTVISNNLIWLSSEYYEIGTIVSVHNKFYRVTNAHDWRDFATFVKYELEGSSQSKDGY